MIQYSNPMRKSRDHEIHHVKFLAEMAFAVSISQSVSESDSEPDILEANVVPHLWEFLKSGLRWWPVPKKVR